MEAKTVRPQVKDIQDRFFQALNTLIENGTIGGLQPFCKQYDLHKPKYSRLRSQFKFPGKVSKYKFIDIDAPAYLVRDYKVSADWLLTGRGTMFR